MQATDLFNLKKILDQLHRCLELLFSITNISSFVLEGINELAQERVQCELGLYVTQDTEKISTQESPQQEHSKAFRAEVLF